MPNFFGGPLANVMNVGYTNVMNVNEINEALIRGETLTPGIFPHLDDLKDEPYVFNMDFGLEVLPEEPGLILIRGARQYGKSTWLEQQLKKTIINYGPGSAFYLNGDEIVNYKVLADDIRDLVSLFNPQRKVRRLFIDEITAIQDWQRGLKRLIDAGELKRVLIITTGSKAVDLRHGTERLPGRKGKLNRTNYYFTPLSYAEFKRVCGGRMGDNTLLAYLLSGGSPVACSELAKQSSLPEYVIEMNRDWIYGECAASGRSRASLLAVLDAISRYGGNPLGQSKLARESGLANNTVADGYVGLLKDLMCVGPSFAWDESRKIKNMRKPCKYHFINLLSAVAWSKERLRSIADFQALRDETRGKWWEWLVAQEIWRRRSIKGDEFPEIMTFWQSKKNEIDFVSDEMTFIEVKGGKVNPQEFAWFQRSFPGAKLLVINQNQFQTQAVRGIMMEDFLLS